MIIMPYCIWWETKQRVELGVSKKAVKTNKSKKSLNSGLGSKATTLLVIA